MAYREVRVMDIEQVIRRWSAGEAIRSIGRATGLDRNTVRRLIRAAQETGVRIGEAIEEQQVRNIQQKLGRTPGRIEFTGLAAAEAAAMTSAFSYAGQPGIPAFG